MKTWMRMDDVSKIFSLKKSVDLFPRINEVKKSSAFKFVF